ncbi:hypothetical protein BBBOND_0309410 [Babesia bigemina]|uniref:Ribosome binding protein n=1 Tax=Babesia bigemina TaxID=5866 RepID=A0A061D913_BABBI|nr:hypothetical protein BBBOND_0309410 [Babesia bigemina]CDR97038.1 hypothetical protein BBBOND_0309410 [Babesia bigemina]|eukprot:XP_012769224.1 hypothetical protein BBBOND_0309410 [Babesia bigemina]
MTKIRISTLKECFEFLEWLNGRQGQKNNVGATFVQRLTPYFQQMSKHKGALQFQYNTFLSNVSTLRTKLLSRDVARLGNYNVNTGDKNHILDALLECIPKFLAALYYLQYHVDDTYTDVGGGDWASESTNSGDFRKFLTSGNNILPCGFSPVELSSVKGSALVFDLKKILHKEVNRSGKAVHDHFRNVVLTTLGKPWNNFNTGNAVLLVYAFCQLVMQESRYDGGAFKTALETGLIEHKICWKDLKDHCQILHGHIDTLTAAGFSVTGRGIKPTRKEDFAKVAAKWFRDNLPTAASVLSEMIPHSVDISTLRSYAKDKLYPNGFIFDGSNHSVWPSLTQLNKWDPIFQKFGQLDEMLGRLKDILEGKNIVACKPIATKTEAAKPTATKTEATKTEAAKPVVTKAEAAKPTATKTEATKPTAGKTEATKTESTKPVVTKAEVTKTDSPQPEAQNVENTQSQAKKAEGAQNQGKKSEGAQNQGKKAEGGQSQKGQSGDRSSSLQAPNPVAAPASDAKGYKGDAGSAGAKGQMPTELSQSQDTSHKQVAQQQQIQQTQSPASPPSAPAAPSPAGPTSDGGTIPKGSDSPGKHPVSSTGVVYSAAPGVPPPDPLPSAAGAPGSPGASGMTSNNGDSPASQFVTTTTAVITQPPSISNPGTPSHGASGSSGGTGQVGQAGASGSGQPRGQEVQTGKSATPTKSTGPGAGTVRGGSGGGAGAGDTRMVDPELEERLKVYEKLLKEKKDRDDKNMQTILNKFNENLEQIEQQKMQQQMQNDLQRQLLANISSANIRLNENIAGSTGGRTLNWHHPYDPKNLTRRLQAVNRLQSHALDGREVWNKSPSDLYMEKRHEEWERQCEEEQRKKDQTYNDTILHLKNRQDVDKERIQLSQKQHEQTVLDSLQSMQQIEHENAKITSVATGLDGETADTFDVKEVSDADNEVVFDGQRAVEIEGQEVHDAEEFLKQQKQDAEQIRSEAQLVASLYDRQQKTLLNGNEVLEPFNVEEELFQPVAQSDMDLYKPNGDISTAISNIPDVGMTGHAITSPPEVDVKIQSVPVKPEYMPDPILPDFDISIDIPALLVPESLEDYDYGPSYRLPTAIGRDKQDANTFDPPRLASERGIPLFANPYVCRDPWSVTPYSPDTPPPPTSPPPTSDHLPPPKTVREMLFWFVGLNQSGYIWMITEHVKDLLMSNNTDALDVIREPFTLDASHVAAKLTETCLYSANVLYRIKYRDDCAAYKEFKLESVYSQLRYSPDPACLLCQLRDYVYACHYQLQFLKSQCKRDKLSGGWQDYKYGSDITSSKSPLQSFLTDGWDSTFKTHPFDPCNLCHKSRIRMGFRDKDLPKSSQQGNVISSILTPSCGGSDPLLTLASYLNGLTRRTPRTTGELVSFFHHFGIELHDYGQKDLSPLGKSLSTPHPDCPDWDHLGRHDLQAVSGIRGSEILTTIHNSKHDHADTLSTLVGCSSDATICHPHCSPITYRAYALYSHTFAHTYLSWTVYLPDRLWESLEKLYYELKKHDYAKCSSLYLCSTAPPLLYLHGFTPPEVGSQPKLTCSDVIAKLQEIVNGGPIASLMTAMDNFLYGIREPFIFTIVALWSLAFLIFANTMLYRLDVLHIRSHLIRTKASHLIDVKALLTKGRKMLSLYKDVDYFDEDPIGQLVI